MVITGPWDLSGFPDVNYGVQFMPSFDAGGSHETIAGPGFSRSANDLRTKLDQFKGVEGFTVPDCSFKYSGND